MKTATPNRHLPEPATDGETLDAVLDGILERASATTADAKVREWLLKLLADGDGAGGAK